MSSIDPAVAGVLAMRNAAMKSDVMMTIAKKSLDMMEQQGQAVVQMIESAGRVGKSPGKGGNFDGVG
ncbi:MAG: hypothetical protein COA78_08315 [Blastopirellula sp.]|nr:MAG: hypothetical protein COA78_08315 [Blastopirellula sp.]